MKILVLSDSHGNAAPMKRAIIDEKPEHVIFLGDGINDTLSLEYEFPSAEIVRICGNNDFSLNLNGRRTALREFSGVIAGLHIFAAHGHTYGVSDGTWFLAEHAAHEGAQLVLYGHTHDPLISEERGMKLLNPGSIGYGGTYGLITVADGVFSVSIKRLTKY